MERKYDMILFGATGFTGKFSVDELSRVALKENLKWAIAGRSVSKLRMVLKECSARLGRYIEDTPIIIADTSDDTSLVNMARQTRMVLNVVGPYRFYGEQVVKACIEGGAHHLDLSGEPHFLEKMQLKYHEQAKENNVLVVGATGFDSVPTEMGLLYTHQQFKGEITNVDMFVSADTGPSGMTINTGTLESALHGIANYHELRPLRKQLFKETVPRPEYTLPKREGILNTNLFYDKEVNKWGLPHLGSDKSIVTRSMRDKVLTGRLSKPYEFRPYVGLKSLSTAIRMMIFVKLMTWLSAYDWGQKFFMKYAHIFSFGFFKQGGPDLKQMEQTSFSMTFIGHGYSNSKKDRTDKKPDKTIKTMISGPEPAYFATPIFMIQCGVTILKEMDKLFHKSGVLPAGTVFYETTLIERLSKNRMTFTTLSN